MLTISQAQMPESRAAVRDLFAEYLEWGNRMLNKEYGVVLDVGAMLEDDMTATSKFLPPAGCLLLATVDGKVAGCACLRKIGPSIGEIKRMYVRPTYRGQGIGRSLLSAVLDRARQAGYTTLRLDSGRFMREAHTLYKSVGFQEIQPYPESEIPEQFRQHWVFMEMVLVTTAQQERSHQAIA